MRRVLLLVLFLTLPTYAYSFLDDAGIAGLQAEVSGVPVGERIARWAEEFVGTPYDPDPTGEYVTRRVIVADERVDCMYHTFRSVELAFTGAPGEAVALALEKRFITKGVIKDGAVQNYEDRFQYAMDMLRSGKWGTEVTARLARTAEIQGSRGVDTILMVPKEHIPETFPALKSGDIVFFVKDPNKRVVGEVIGHIGIVKREGGEVYLIHASGRKNGGGEVRKVSFRDYAGRMPFVGIKASRFGGRGVSTR
jgi:hypothetical protein